MSVSWPTVVLGDVCEKITDGAHSSPKSVEFGKPMASVKDLTNFGVNLVHARLISEEDFEKLVKQGCRPQVGDVLIAKDGNSALDTVCTVDRPLEAVLLSSVAILSPDKSKLDSNFLKYYFCSKNIIDYLKSNFISGAAIPRVVLKDLRKAEIKLPPISLQKRISKKLEDLDKKIFLNIETNKNLEQIAQAIFKSWFVDFEPTKAKIAAREALLAENPDAPPEQIATAEQQSAIQAIAGAGDVIPTQHLETIASLFPNTLVDSELGRIPEGWNTSEVRDFGQVVCGKTPPKKKPEFYGGSIPFIKIPDMHGGVFSATYSDYLTEEGALSQPKKELPAGTVCVSCIATVGKTLITHRRSHTNQQINSVVPYNSISAYYLYFNFKQKTKMLLDLASGGSATLNMNTSTFSKVPLIAPSDKVLKKFHETVEPIFAKILVLTEEIETLGGIRDTMLPKLLSGELDASNA